MFSLKSEYSKFSGFQKPTYQFETPTAKFQIKLEKNAFKVSVRK